MAAFGLSLALLLVCSSFLYVSCSSELDDATRTLVIRQFLDKYQPALLIHPGARRFRRFDMGVSSLNLMLFKIFNSTEF